MLTCLQLLGTTKAADQIDFGLVEQVVKIVDNCISALNTMQMLGFQKQKARQVINRCDSTLLALHAECESIADLLCISYEWLGLISADDLGRFELLRMSNYRIFNQLYNTAVFAMQKLQLMGLHESLEGLKQLTGWFLRSLTLKQKNTNRKGVI